MDLNKYFDLLFWLDIAPQGLDERTAVFFISFFAGLLLLKFLGKMLYIRYKHELHGPEKKMVRMIESFLLTMGFAGLAWTFFAYEALPVVSAKFWIIVWCVSTVLWLYVIVYYIFMDMPRLLREQHEKEKFEQYLPKKRQ